MTSNFAQRHILGSYGPYQNLGQIDHNLHNRVFDDVICKPPIQISEFGTLVPSGQSTTRPFRCAPIFVVLNNNMIHAAKFIFTQVSYKREKQIRFTGKSITVLCNFQDFQAESSPVLSEADARKRFNLARAGGHQGCICCAIMVMCSISVA